MQVTFDTISVVQPPPITPAPQPLQRPRVAPAQNRDRSENNADKGTDFKTALDGALGGQSSAPAVRSEEHGRSPTRPQKYPTVEAAAVDANERAELYTQTKAGAAMASHPEFVASASEYAARFFSVASTFARPGEKLELTA